MAATAVSSAVVEAGRPTHPPTAAAAVPSAVVEAGRQTPAPTAVAVDPFCPVVEAGRPTPAPTASVAVFSPRSMVTSPWFGCLLVCLDLLPLPCLCSTSERKIKVKIDR